LNEENLQIGAAVVPFERSTRNVGHWPHRLVKTPHSPGRSNCRDALLVEGG